MTAALVGRGAEASLLETVIAELPNASAAVLVRGEAGVGKTSLVQQVLQERRESGLRILRGACAPMSGAVAYGGLAAALGRSFGKGGETMVFPSAAAGRAQTIEELSNALDDGPPLGTVLLVEDVHWADWSTLDFLTYSTRNLPERRLLVLLTWRDEVTDPQRTAWLAEQLRNPSITDLALRRLTLEETRLQLAGLRPDLTQDEADAVFRRSAGNPYLTAELASTYPAASISLRQILSARLQAVSPAARMVVAATSTLPRALSDDDLLAAADGDIDAVRDACDSGLVIRDPTGGATAKHPVLAEVAYEQLLSEQRRRLHAKLAEHLETGLLVGAGAAAVAEVAEQYHRAEDPDATLTWSVKAARAAESRFALAEAGHWYAVASSVRPSSVTTRSDVPTRLVLAEAAASLLGGAGQPDKAREVLDQALADVPEQSVAGDDVVPALLTRSWLGVVVGDTGSALKDAERAEQLISPDDGLIRGKVLCARAMALVTASRLDEAAAPARAAFDLADRGSDERTTCRAAMILSAIDSGRERFDEALGHLNAALSIARRIAQPEEIALAGVNLTDLYWRLGDCDRAVEVVELIRPELRRLTLGRHWLEDLMEGNLIDALFDAGRWDEALTLGRDQAEWSGLGMIENVLAQVHVARGDLQTALELQQRSLRLSSGDQPMFQVGFANVQVPLHLLEGRPREALAVALSTAEQVASRLNDPICAPLLLAGLEAAVAVEALEEFERLVALLGHAVSTVTAAAVTATVEAERSRLHRSPDAALWLRAAREWSRLSRPYPEARARLRAAEAFLAQRDRSGTRSRATGELKAARRTAELLGARPLLAEIDELARIARLDLADSPGPGARRSQHPGHGLPALTDRERQVLALLTEGRTNREIGEALYMSPKTASVHVTHLLEKLGVQTRVQAAAMAVRLGLDDQQTESR
ncbi:helix-turn-helix transcriptional regulator [Kribbella caucasensis]|nr:LuxR C-terminal-related transcriptional regulator [Kribbella sp. VKM Ac-2527]